MNTIEEEDPYEKYKVEISRLKDLYKNASKESNEIPSSELFAKYSKSQKYSEFCSKFPVVFHVTLLSKVYCLKAFIKYLTEYHRCDIDCKERFMEVQLTYLRYFSFGLLRDKHLDRDIFIQLYTDQMETLFSVMENILSKEREEAILERQKLVNLETLKKKLSILYKTD